MTSRNVNPPMLDGCDVLPAMDSAEQIIEPKPRKKKSGHRKTGKRFADLNAFVDTTAGKLSRSELLVWLVLFRDARNEIARTSQADIARRAQISDRTVRYAIGKLIKQGLLVLVYRGGINKGPSKYRISPDLKGEPLRQ